MFFTSRHAQHGFTLIELLITMAITGILMSAIANAFITQRKSFALQEQISEMRQNVRVAVDGIVREVRMTGYGVPPASQLSAWIDWIPGFTSNPLITQGFGAAPDTLSIASCVDAAKLSVAANQGATTLTVEAGTDNTFNTTTKKVVYIGRNEHAVITGVTMASGKLLLTIDTDPITPGLQGLRWSYPADTTPVELLKVITYRIGDNTLKRDENTGAGAQPLAENIENLQVTPTGNALTLSLTGKTTNADASYTHPTSGDQYRRIELSSRVQLRNLGL
jgi:prepilin-type N-terminal cleavage/methylation domain-containing protein